MPTFSILSRSRPSKYHRLQRPKVPVFLKSTPQLQERPLSQVVDEHHAARPRRSAAPAITVSDTRTPPTDTGGQLLHDLLIGAGFVVNLRQIVHDDPAVLKPLLERLHNDEQFDAVLLTGGTGISSRDE